MTEFLGESYLIGNESGRRLFKSISGLPIIDPHNHADVAALAANENFSDVWTLFGATDHYVWEVMRKAGVDERFITGAASNREKFLALAGVFDDLIGNPVYEWMHLDLRFLGIDERLCAASGEQIWSEANRVLALPESKPQELLKRLNVEAMCSTDDPADRLDLHAKLNAGLGGAVRVHPTWRPDKAMKIAAAGFAEYIGKLGKRFNMAIADIDSLLEALRLSHDYFAQNGCHASDHGLEVVPCGSYSRGEANEVFCKALAGKTLTPAEIDGYMAFMLGEFGELNASTGWVTQLHAGAVRDVRAMLFNTIGPDSGGDVCSLHQDQLPGVVQFLNRFDGRLKVVLYSLDPTQQPTLATIARAFGASVRLGSAWWLADTPVGMKRQLEYIGSVDLYSAFAGMVSDSRKLLSYGSRFEMFRRTLANVLGAMVEAGQFPYDAAEKLAKKMCYNGPKTYWEV
ncbi:MAG: glucuronate isomerase [Victivallaceae bacterium]|nr:glucuronate isomerase [Victivallaceae bacterium]